LTIRIISSDCACPLWRPFFHDSACLWKKFACRDRTKLTERSHFGAERFAATYTRHDSGRSQAIASPLPLGFFAFGIGSVLQSALQLGLISQSDVQKPGPAIRRLRRPAGDPGRAACLLRPRECGRHYLEHHRLLLARPRSSVQEQYRVPLTVLKVADPLSVKPQSASVNQLLGHVTSFPWRCVDWYLT
jgi:hypothetical protein